MLSFTRNSMETRHLNHHTDLGHFINSITVINSLQINCLIINYKIMTLVKFKPRRRPIGGLTARNFFDTDYFLGDRLWNGVSLLDDFWNGKSSEPALNIKEQEDKFEIELAAPGFSKKDFEVTLDNGNLNISAEKSDSKKEKGENYTRQEFSYNSFSRSLQLPESVKADNIKAHYHDGILSFDLAKKEESKKLKPKKIEIA